MYGLESSTTKLTSYFSSIHIKECKPFNLTYNHYKGSKTITICPVFGHGKNSELLQLYNEYKKNDCLCESASIVYKNSFWYIIILKKKYNSFND